jgi:hypothetical protein
MSLCRKPILLFLLSSLLFVCLACLELPEMSRLVDDASNDYTNLTSLRTTSAVARAVQVVESDGCVGRLAERREGLSRAVLQMERLERPESSDRLALQSTWRT